MSTTTSQEALSSGPHEHLNSRELQHHYGDRIHILENPLLSTALKRFSDPSTDPAGMLELLRTTYQYLAIDACGREFGTVETQTPTRMAETHREAGLLKAEVLNPETNVVVVDIVRAGIVPSQVCFELLCSVLPAHQVRLDHLTLARTSDEQGRVTGVDLSGSKIGGSVEGAVLIMPDPMGATGSTTLRVLEHYQEQFGCPAKVILMPLICTPEYLRAVTQNHGHTVVYSTRLDRGLSPAHVQASVPGTHWEQERGLDETSYIVPGAGGVGELLNNSWC